MIEIRLSEDDSILGRVSPRLHEVYSVSAAQGRVSCEDHAGRLVHGPQSPVHVGEVLQAPTVDKLGGNQPGRERQTLNAEWALRQMLLVGASKSTK